MPTAEEIRESPPGVRNDLVDSMDVEEVAGMLDDELPIEFRSNTAQYQIWVPVASAREWLKDELGEQ